MTLPFGFGRLTGTASPSSRATLYADGHPHPAVGGWFSRVVSHRDFARHPPCFQQAFVYSVCVVPGTSRFASCGEDSCLKIWEADKSVPIQNIDLPCVSVWNTSARFVGEVDATGRCVVCVQLCRLMSHCLFSLFLSFPVPMETSSLAAMTAQRASLRTTAAGWCVSRLLPALMTGLGLPLRIAHAPPISHIHTTPLKGRRR
jgi:hypothetical protein